MAPHPWEMRIQLPWKILAHPISWRLLPRCQYNINGNLIFYKTCIILALMMPSISVHTVHVGLSLCHLSGTLYWHITSTHDSLSDVVETMVYMFHICRELFFVFDRFRISVGPKNIQYDHLTTNQHLQSQFLLFASQGALTRQCSWWYMRIPKTSTSGGLCSSRIPGGSSYYEGFWIATNPIPAAKFSRRQRFGFCIYSRPSKSIHMALFSESGHC